MPASDYGDLYQSAGQQYNVDPQLLRAIVTTESDGRPGAVSSAGAEGIAQLMPATAKSLGVADSFDPKQAIPAAAKLMAENLDRYGNTEDAVRAYHGGTDQGNWGPKTQAYLAKVTSNYTPAKEGSAMPQAAAAPEDDAFSAAFSTSAPTKIAQPANDAFSAAFGAPASVAPAQAAALTPAGKPHAPGLTGVVADLLTGNLKGNPTLQAIAPIAGDVKQLGADITDAVTKRGDELKRDFTAPLDPSRTILGHDISAIVPPTPMADRALKIVGDSAATLASPIEGAGTYLLGRPLASLSDIASAHGIGNRLTPRQVGEDVSMVAQMAGGGIRAPEAAGLPAAQEAAPANRLAAPVRTDPWFGATQPAQEVLPPAQGNTLLPWGSETKNALMPQDPAISAIPEKLPPKPLLPVITQAGANKQADRIIAHFAGDSPVNVDTSQIVPGSTPTLAHATGNPGIATLERGFMDANPGPFADRMAANDAARTELIQNTIGTPEDIQAAITARDRQTADLRDAAFAPGNVDRADAAPVVSKINEILASPSGQRDAVQSSLKNILAKIQVKDPETGAVTLQSDPEQLYGIRKAIGDALSPLSAGTAADGRQAARELGQVQDALDRAIESGAPGFSKYIDAYSAASRPIDGMKYLQGLNLTDAKGNITLAKVDSAIKTINKQQQAGGAKAVKSVSDDQLANLTAVRDDLRRQANIYNGKSLGSTTFQNLATNAATGALGNPLVAHGATLLGGLHPAIGIPLAAARFGGNRLANRGEAMVQQALQNRLLNPGNGAAGSRPTILPNGAQASPEAAQVFYDTAR